MDQPLWELFLAVLRLSSLISFLASFPLRAWGSKSLEQYFLTSVSQFYVRFEK